MLDADYFCPRDVAQFFLPSSDRMTYVVHVLEGGLPCMRKKSRLNIKLFLNDFSCAFLARYGTKIESRFLFKQLQILAWRLKALTRHFFRNRDKDFLQ